MTIEEILALLDSVLGNPNATPEEMAAALAQVQEALVALAAPATAGDDEATVADTNPDQVLAAAEKVKQIKARRQKALDAREALKQAAIDVKAAQTPVNTLPTGTKSNGGSTVEIKSGFRSKPKHYKSAEDAFKVAQFLRAQMGDRKAADWYAENVGFKTLTEGDANSAGILVPEVMEEAIWNLKEPNGIIRRFARVVNMSGPVSKRIKFVNGPTTYFVGEGTAPTASDVDYRILTLSAKKLAVLTKATYELADDAMVNIVDQITSEAAYALTQKEDQCGFIGDASSTYGGMLGLRYAFQKVLEDGGGTWTTDADKAKLGSAIVAAGNAWSEVTDANIVQLRGKVRQGQSGTYAYFCHSAFYYNVMLPLARGKGGVTYGEAVNGAANERYDGFPVIFTEVMPSSEVNSDIPLYFGNLEGGIDFGDLRSTTVETDKNIQTQVWDVVTTQRFDINVHDIGNYNATAASRTRGSAAALILLNS